MDVMGTLDLSIQGWFINPDDIVRTFTHMAPLLLPGYLVNLQLTNLLSSQGSPADCRKSANERTAVTGCWEQVLVQCWRATEMLCTPCF